MICERLLSSVQIGAMQLKNRFVVPPMGTNFGNSDGSVSSKVINYYGTRAKGGFGLIITEVAAIDPKGRAIPKELGIWSDDFIPGLKQLVDVVHGHGAKIAIQLHHCGRQTVPACIGGEQPVAPSKVPCPLCQAMPHELTTSEVWDVIRQFGEGAARAKKAGFDAVEIHGAHGYLVAQFMSQHANKRIDEFGGNLESRMKFPLEVLKSIREAVGPDYPVLFRISSDELVTDGRTINESRAVCMMLEEAGIDAIHVSVCTYGSLDWMSAPSDVPMGFNSGATEDIKHIVKVPVIAVGRMNDVYTAEAIVRAGKADLIAFGRESLADPEIPNKVRDGRIDEILPCLACLQGCLTSILSPDGKGEVCCVMNPFTGSEGSLSVTKAKTKKKVMVVGSGPAGLEAAWILARRGHDVTCYEKEEVLGGQFRIAGIPPTKQDLLAALKQLITVCKKSGVTFVTGVEVTPELVAASHPDAVIVASGATPLVPKIPGIDGPSVFHAKDVLEGNVQVGQRVLVIGGGMVGAETADYLSEYHKSVVVVEMLESIAADVPSGPRARLLQRLNQKKVTLETGAKVTEFLQDGIRYEQRQESKQLAGFDHIVLALGARAFNPLESALKDVVREVYVVGDAVRARRVSDATSEAAAIAVTI